MGNSINGCVFVFVCFDMSPQGREVVGLGSAMPIEHNNLSKVSRIIGGGFYAMRDFLIAADSLGQWKIVVWFCVKYCNKRLDTRRFYGNFIKKLYIEL